MNYLAPVPDPVVAGGFSYVTGTFNTTGDHTVIAAPNVGQQIVIVAMSLQNEAGTPNVLLLKAGGSIYWRVLAQNQGDGLITFYAPGRGDRLGSGNPLVLNLSANTQVGYSFKYYYDNAS